VKEVGKEGKSGPSLVVGKESTELVVARAKQILAVALLVREVALGCRLLDAGEELDDVGLELVPIYEIRKKVRSARKSQVRVSVNDAPSSRNGSDEDVSLLVSQAPVKLREGRRVSCGTVNRRELDTLVTSITLVKSNDLALDAVGESGSQLKLGAPSLNLLGAPRRFTAFLDLFCVPNGSVDVFFDSTNDWGETLGVLWSQREFKMRVGEAAKLGDEQRTSRILDLRSRRAVTKRVPAFECSGVSSSCSSSLSA